MQINTNKLKVQPVNFMERYSFIIKKPSNYHSYIQLAQLYIEIEKLYVKKMITKKEVRFSLRETDFFFCILGLCCNNSTVCVRCISSGILVLLFLLFLSLFFSFFLGLFFSFLLSFFFSFFLSFFFSFPSSFLISFLLSFFLLFTLLFLLLFLLFLSLFFSLFLSFVLFYFIFISLFLGFLISFFLSFFIGLFLSLFFSFFCIWSSARRSEGCTNSPGLCQYLFSLLQRSCK